MQHNVSTSFSTKLFSQKANNMPIWLTLESFGKSYFVYMKTYPKIKLVVLA